MITSHRLSPPRALSFLLALGAASLIVYAVAFALPYPLAPLVALEAPADIGAISGYSRAAAALYVGSLVLLFGLYGAAMRAATVHLAATGPASSGPSGTLRNKQAIWIVFGVGVGAVLLLAFVYPYGAADIFLYIVRGRVLGVYGLNSSVVPPSYTPVEGYLPFASEWVAVASPYGPLWEWVAAGLARLGDGSLLASLLAFKGWGALCYLGSGLLLSDILRRVQPARWLPGLVALMWNPLVLLETMAMGHNDLFMVLFVLLAIWLGVRSCYGGVYVALALGALVKYVPLLLLPPTLIWMRRHLSSRVYWRHLLGGVLVALLLTGLIWWPLWPGWRSLPFLKQMGRGHFSLGIWIILLLRKLRPSGDFYSFGIWATRTAFAVAYASVIVRALRGQGRLGEHYHSVLYAWLVFGAFAFGYWYIIWLVALMPLIDNRQLWLRVITFAFAGLFSVAFYTYGDVWLPGHQTDLWLVGGVLVFGLPWSLAYILDRLAGREERAPIRSATP
jgi:alpha-1,6-mannosyltransferase